MSSFTLIGFIMGPTELAIAAGIALLLFGNRLPTMMRSMGRGFHEFRAAASGARHELEDAA